MILFDMDGVLCDLHSMMYDRFGLHPVPFDSPRHLRRPFQKALVDFADQGGFAELAKMPRADELATTTSDPHFANCRFGILTSHGSFHTTPHLVVSQKMAWLQKHYPALARLPFTVVPGAHIKAHYAHRRALLLDDTASAVALFTNAGGTGVLYSHELHDEAMTTMRNWV